MFAIWFVTSIAMTAGGWISIIGKSGDFCGFAVVDNNKVFWCNCEGSSITLSGLTAFQSMRYYVFTRSPSVTCMRHLLWLFSSSFGLWETSTYGFVKYLFLLEYMYEYIASYMYQITSDCICYLRVSVVDQFSFKFTHAYKEQQLVFMYLPGLSVTWMHVSKVREMYPLGVIIAANPRYLITSVGIWMDLQSLSVAPLIEYFIANAAVPTMDFKVPDECPSCHHLLAPIH